MMREELIAKVSNFIRKHYCFLRARRQGLKRMRITDPKYDKFFDRAAVLCIDLGIDPREYLEVEFERRRPYPQITMLGSDAAEARFRDTRFRTAAKVATKLKIQMSALEQLMRLGRTEKEILTDPLQEFDPLFRYVMCKECGLDELAEQYKDAALLMYLSSCYYDSLYKDMIPEEFRKRSKEVRV